MYFTYPVTDSLRTPFFIGKVEDNKDPTFSYRIKVRIEYLHPQNITTEQLPWAARVDTAFMGMGESQDVDHKIPEVGTDVLVLAVGNNTNSLVYLGCLYKKSPFTPTGDQYLSNYGVYRANGQFIGIDKIQKLFQMLFEGDVIIDKVKNMTIRVSNAVSIECQTANVKATNSVTLDTPSTTLTGNLQVNGTVHSNGQITSDAEVSANSGAVTLSKHTHLYNPGPGGPTPTQTGQG